jgi:hypothetical protein
MLVPPPIPLTEKFLYFESVLKLLKVKPVELVKFEEILVEKVFF